MPAYNGERYLDAAVRSILTQSYTDFEYIIIDDGSTDGTNTILNAFKDTRIRLLRNERNLGIVASLNRGIAAATGMYICRMDADDIAAPERLKRQVAFLNDHPDIALVGCSVGLVNETGALVGKESFPTTSEEIRRTIFIRNPFAHGSVVVRSAVLRAVGNYDARFLHNEDYDLWLRLASGHRLANIPDQLLFRRLHAGSITVSRETELVRYRIKTIAHAIRAYYRSPFLAIHLVRPVLAYFYRHLKGIVSL
jgi:glycosyltransferase involved in cell wall biosynthesis